MDRNHVLPSTDGRFPLIQASQIMYILFSGMEIRFQEHWQSSRLRRKRPTSGVERPLQQSRHYWCPILHRNEWTSRFRKGSHQRTMRKPSPPERSRQFEDRVLSSGMFAYLRRKLRSFQFVWNQRMAANSENRVSGCCLKPASSEPEWFDDLQNRTGGFLLLLQTCRN